MSVRIYDSSVIAPETGKTYDVTVSLTDTEGITDPGSTRRVMYGPAVIVLRRWSDGGLDVVAYVTTDEALVLTDAHLRQQGV